jgi:hypothetical protein
MMAFGLVRFVEEGGACKGKRERIKKKNHPRRGTTCKASTSCSAIAGENADERHWRGNLVAC